MCAFKHCLKWCNLEADHELSHSAPGCRISSNVSVGYLSCPHIALQLEPSLPPGSHYKVKRHHNLESVLIRIHVSINKGHLKNSTRILISTKHTHTWSHLASQRWPPSSQRPPALSHLLQEPLSLPAGAAPLSSEHRWPAAKPKKVESVLGTLDMSFWDIWNAPSTHLLPEMLLISVDFNRSHLGVVQNTTVWKLQWQNLLIVLTGKHVLQVKRTYFQKWLWW